MSLDVIDLWNLGRTSNNTRVLQQTSKRTLVAKAKAAVALWQCALQFKQVLLLHSKHLVTRLGLQCTSLLSTSLLCTSLLRTLLPDEQLKPKH